MPSLIYFIPNNYITQYMQHKKGDTLNLFLLFFLYYNFLTELVGICPVKQTVLYRAQLCWISEHKATKR